MSRVEGLKTLFITKPLEVLSMNRASLRVRIDGEHYLVTRRVFNEIQSGKYTDLVFVMSKPDQRGILINWLAIPTMF